MKMILPLLRDSRYYFDPVGVHLLFESLEQMVMLAETVYWNIEYAMSPSSGHTHLGGTY